MTFSALIAFVTPQKRQLAAIVALLTLSSVTALFQPWLAGQLTQAISAQGPDVMVRVNMVLAIWLLLLLLRAFVQYVAARYSARVSEDMSATLRRRSFEQAQSLPLPWHQQRQGGATLSLLVQDTETISTFVTSTLVGLLPALLVLFGALAYMASISPGLALVCGSLLPLYYVGIKLLSRRMRPLSRQVQDAWADKMGFLQEHFNVLPVVKAFGREPETREENRRKNLQLTEALRARAELQARLNPVATLMGTFGLLLLVWLAVGQLEKDLLTVSDIASLFVCALLLNSPLAGLSNSYGRIQAALGSAERLQSLFAALPEPLNDDKPELTVLRGEIRFKHVSFSYPERPPVLADFSLRVPGGEITVITGQNGVGKTTLTQLLLRFEEPDAGQILIDDQPISACSLKSVRSAIGLVAQHTMLLNGTIRDNLRFGRWDASDEELVAACKASGALGFVSELPHGLETIIGDQGVRLSGGQRQRLSLARTLLKDPPIVILDEATSMLDPVGHAEILDELRAPLQGKTVILITHQEQNRALADHEVRLGDGE